MVVTPTISNIIIIISGRSRSSRTLARTSSILYFIALFFNKTIIMGILNVTPDSFTDGGKHTGSVDSVACQAIHMEEDGADIIDVGGESTRPGAEDVTADEELSRVIAVITRIRELGSNVPISINTRCAIVAKSVIEAGADIVNDVSGGTYDPDMLPTVSALGVPIVLMHMRGNPKTMQFRMQ